MPPGARSARRAPRGAARNRFSAIDVLAARRLDQPRSSRRKDAVIAAFAHGPSKTGARDAAGVAGIAPALRMSDCGLRRQRDAMWRKDLGRRKPPIGGCVENRASCPSLALADRAQGNRGTAGGKAHLGRCRACIDAAGARSHGHGAERAFIAASPFPVSSFRDPAPLSGRFARASHMFRTGEDHVDGALNDPATPCRPRWR